MNEMIGYIFGSLHNSEDAIKHINKALKSQAKLNKYFAIMAIMSTGYMYICDYERKKQNRKIEALSKEIEELKMKGE